MTIHVVGGVYREYCVHPRWNDIYGSGGRASLAIASLDVECVLHSYMDDQALEVLKEKGAWLGGFQARQTTIARGAGFRYLHDLAVPTIYGVPKVRHPSLEVVEDNVVRFGMLEGDAVVRAKRAVYDPQNVRDSAPFGGNGSTAEQLALVLNLREARDMASLPDGTPRVVAEALAAQHGAEVVVVKMGPQGALVWMNSTTAQVPAYRTKRVWKIGSGDCFVAHFAAAWMEQGLSAVEAAEAASRATAYYCETQALPTRIDLAGYAPIPVLVSPGYMAGETRQVYLAAPFFDLMQLWMVEQARENLAEMGLRVFSPYHDVGLGTADEVVEKDLAAIHESHVVFAVADGLDAGTIYEVGYARAGGKPVVVFCERHYGEGTKMMEGSGCTMCENYTTAIYSALWEAVKI